MSLGYLSTQVLNGLSFGALLFLLASGFTLIFGLMRIVNLAHGASTSSEATSPSRSPRPPAAIGWACSPQSQAPHSSVC